MIDLLSTGKNKKKVSVKYLFLTIFICISMVAWLGISDLRADGNDPEPYPDQFEGGVNDAQTERLENLANQAASLDSNPGHDVAYYENLIESMRENGMGWGKIVHTLNTDEELNLNPKIHPSVLGLGHSSNHSSMQSGNNQGKGLALGHNKENSSNHSGGGHGDGHGGGHGGGNGGGNGGGRK